MIRTCAEVSNLAPFQGEVPSYLSSDVPEQVFYVLSDESILHDRLPVHFQDLLKLIDVVVLKIDFNRKFSR